jgi:hypothetical protein
MAGPGQDYYRRKRDQGKTHLEALRCLKRRLCDIVYRYLVDDLAASTPEQSLPVLAHDPTPDLTVVS